MKPLKTLGGLILTSSALFLVTSCSKNVGDQMAKGDKEVGQFLSPPCEPFVGLQVKKGDPAGTFVFYGNHKTPAETQAFWGNDFSANNLMAITATGGTPYLHGPFPFIGVTNEWIDGSEVLSLKLSGSLAGKAANKMQMQLRAKDLVGAATFYLGGMMVGSLPLSSGPVQEVQFVSYESSGEKSDFDEVRFSVTAGRMALTAYTPNNQPGGQGYSGFYMVEKAGRAVVGRFVTGTTTILGVPRANQYFTFESSYGNPAPAIERQNKALSPSGEFPTNQWAGAKHWVNIWGETAGVPTPLGWGTDVPASMRLGVGNSTVDGTDVVYITPGADFPDGGVNAKLRSVQVRTATLQGSVMIVKAWAGATMVGSATSSGSDASYVFLAPGVNFDKVSIEAQSGADLSIGRKASGPINATIKLYPACP